MGYCEAAPKLKSCFTVVQPGAASLNFHLELRTWHSLLPLAYLRDLLLCIAYNILYYINPLLCSEHLLAVQAHVKQNHGSVLALLLRLKENTLLVATVRAQFVGSWQSRIRADVLHRSSGLADIRDEFMSVDFWVLCQLRVVAVSARV